MSHIKSTTSEEQSGETPTPPLQIAVFPLPAYGHVNPTLRTAEELVRRGHEVRYYLPDRFTEVVEPTGATLDSLDDNYDMMSEIRDGKAGLHPDPDEADEHRERLVQFMFDSLDRTSALADRVAAADPDRVLIDPMCLWGRAVADELDTPTVEFNSSFAMREGSPLIEEISLDGSAEGGGLPDAMTEVLAAVGIEDPSPSDMFVTDADRSLVPLTHEFQPDSDAFGDEYAFVGPMIRAGDEQRDTGLPLDHLAESPSTYISLGTIVSGNEAFFRMCFEAFSDSRWEVVLKAKGDAKRLDQESPNNVHVRTRVPQLDVLERVDTFVTHGGMNSTMESLWFGTPPIIVPQVADQHVIADRINALGVGVTLDQTDLTAGRIRDAVSTASADIYREAVAEFRSTARAAGGAERAATIVERTTET